MKFLFSFLIVPFGIFSQQWTLDNCIDSALQNNRALKSGVLHSRIASVNLQISKQNLLPSLNAGVTHGYNWGQTIDLFTNQFATNRVMYDNFYLSSSVVLFAGLQNYYAIKANNLSVEQTLVDQEIAERAVKTDVSAAFLQVLLNKEILNLSKETRQKTQQQFDRMKELINQKQATRADLMEIEAQLQQDVYLVVKSENDLKYSKLLLQQLLNIPLNEGFDVSDVFFEQTQRTHYSDTAVARLPEIIKLELGIQKQVYLIKSLKGRYYPALTLNGSLGSGYSENNKVLNTSGQYVSRPFNEQIDKNLYQSVFATLTIPIFNKNAIRNQQKVKQLELESLYLDKESEYTLLKQKLDQLSLEIVNSESQLEALQVVYTSALLNCENFQIRYDAGEGTYTQLTEAQNKLFQAKSNLLQTQYQLLFQKMILGFYFTR